MNTLIYRLKLIDSYSEAIDGGTTRADAVRPGDRILSLKPGTRCAGQGIKVKMVGVSTTGDVCIDLVGDTRILAAPSYRFRVKAHR